MFHDEVINQCRSDSDNSVTVVQSEILNYVNELFDELTSAVCKCRQKDKDFINTLFLFSTPTHFVFCLIFLGV